MPGSEVELKPGGDGWGSPCTEANTSSARFNIVFSGSKLKVGDNWLLEVDWSEDHGRPAIGITSCDPSQMTCDDLRDSLDLIDRPEYWIIQQNFDPPDCFEHFVIILAHDGCLRLLRSGHDDAQDLFYFDTSQPLWVVLDFRRRFVRLTSWCVFTCDHPASGLPLKDKTSISSQNESDDDDDDMKAAKAASLNAGRCNDVVDESSAQEVPPTDKTTPECVICCVGTARVGIYDCGHMCLCEECAALLRQTPHPQRFPVCRRLIKDIIKMYSS